MAQSGQVGRPEELVQSRVSCLVELLVLEHLSVLEEDAPADSRQALNETYEDLREQGRTPEEVVAGQAGNLALLALQLGFPILKPFLEEQVRRVTVTVRWQEGPRERGFDVIQYLVSEQIASEEGVEEQEGEQ